MGIYLEPREEKHRESRIMITISENRMVASINLTSFDPDYVYSEEDILEELKQRGIVQGIDTNVIRALIKKKIYHQLTVVARGKQPIDGTDGKFIYYFRTEMPIIPKILEDDSVDYKNMDLFEVVKQDQIVAEYVPATKGQFGFSVTGELFVPKRGKELPAYRGNGFRLSEDRRIYTSEMNGKIAVHDGFMEITRTHVVDGDAGVNTGNIKFNGDVCVRGDVISGITIEADGSVDIWGHVENATIRCGGDLVIRRGMQGGRYGDICSGGAVYGSYFESTTIHTKGDFNANYLLNCHVYCDGMVKISGKRGTVIGGITQAIKGITAYTLGNDAQRVTTLMLGLNKEFLENYSDIGRRLIQMEREICIFEQGKADYEQKLHDKLLEADVIYTKILLALNMKLEERDKLLQQQGAFMEAITNVGSQEIISKGNVFPGVKIIIDAEELVLMKPLKNVVFRNIENRIAIFQM